MKYSFLSGLDADELKACAELVEKMRAEKAAEIAKSEATEHLREIAISMIDSIGLETTKQIFRIVTRELRGVN